MSFITLNVKSEQCNFNLELQRRITLIGGNSATGKTTLRNMLLSAEGNPDIEVKCPFKCLLST